MARTYMDVLNEVLVRIGEDEIVGSTTTLSDKYHLLLGSFLNDIKEQIEDAHNWRALRQFVSVTLDANAVSATVTGANERSRVLRIFQADRGVIPMVYDITDSSEPEPLIEIDLAELIHRDTIDPDQRQDPAYFAVDNSAGDVLTIYCWPRPTAARTIKVGLFIPQDRLTPSDLDTTLKIPTRPLVTGTVWYALEERGEEMGVRGEFAQQRFLDALNSAVARDAAEAGDSFELVPV